MIPLMVGGLVLILVYVHMCLFCTKNFLDFMTFLLTFVNSLESQVL
jgi:hypothetical protein